MTGFLNDEQFESLFNFVMEQKGTAFLDNLAIEPLLGLLPSSVLESIPILGDGAEILGEEPVTDFSGENLTWMDTISQWLGAIGLGLMEVTEPFMEFNIENLAVLAGYETAIDFVKAIDVPTALGSTVLDSPSMGVMYYLFNEFDPDALADQIGIE